MLMIESFATWLVTWSQEILVYRVLTTEGSPFMLDDFIQSNNTLLPCIHTSLSMIVMGVRNPHRHQWQVGVG